MMISDNILDENLDSDLEKYLLKNEEIIWKGSPSLSEKNTDRFKRMVTFIFISILIILLGIGINFISRHPNKWFTLITIILTITLFAFSKIYGKKRMKNTFYYVTKNRIYFELWRDGIRSVEFINYEDIKSINKVELNNRGTIYFYTQAKVNFKTYDLENNNMRPTPTFELISNASSISDKIIELRNIKLDSLKKK